VFKKIYSQISVSATPPFVVVTAENVNINYRFYFYAVDQWDLRLS